MELFHSAAQAHVVAVALIAARLLPVAFLCPLLGGQQSPTTVRLGVVLSLSLFVHLAGGVNAPATGSSLALVGLAIQEFVLGTTIGLIAALPFDIARMGGRFIDLFRGSSAEAALPTSGTKESAAGDALYQALLAIAASSLALPLVLSAVFRSFTLAPVGTFTHSEAVALEVVKVVGVAFATGLALGAPVAGVGLLVDAVLGLASRAAPKMNLQDVGTPLRILGGGAVLWLTIGLVADRLMAEVLNTPDTLRSLVELGR